MSHNKEDEIKDLWIQRQNQGGAKVERGKEGE